MEELLHYVWKHKIFPLKKLTTTTGLDLEVIDVGIHNIDAGPDFFNAKVKINGITWVGNIEIHRKATDWYRHGHHKDKNYDSVILHVCSVIDTSVYRSNNELIPQLQLDIPDYVWANYKYLLKMEIIPACHNAIINSDKLIKHSFMSSLLFERIQQRTKQIEERLKRYNNNWEDSFFVTLSRNFGFGINGDAFENWANRLPMNIMAKHRDNIFQIESLFFGQAGMLSENEGDEYYLKLKKEYQYLRSMFNKERIDVSVWKFLRLRPYNFPHVRIAQLAFLYHNRFGLFSSIIEADNIKKVREIFKGETSDYWTTHFSFKNQHYKQSKTMSQSAQNLIIINSVIPFLYAYGRHRACDFLCNRALAFLEELPPESNYIIKMWEQNGLIAENAGDSQALIQLKKEYCDQKKCLYCRFGYEYLRRINH